MIELIKQAFIILFVLGSAWLGMYYVIIPLAHAVSLRALEIVCAPVLIGLQHSFKKQPLRIPKDSEKRSRMMIGAAFILLYVCIGFPLTLFLLLIKPAMQKQLDPSFIINEDSVINSLWPALLPALMFAVGFFTVYRISKKTAEQDHDEEYFKRANFYQNFWKFATWILAVGSAFLAGKHL